MANRTATPANGLASESLTYTIIGWVKTDFMACDWPLPDIDARKVGRPATAVALNKMKAPDKEGDVARTLYGPGFEPSVSRVDA
jgi:hypothetical protein